MSSMRAASTRLSEKPNIRQKAEANSQREARVAPVQWNIPLMSDRSSKAATASEIWALAVAVRH